MDLRKISVGENPPHEVNAVIEVPLGGDPVKYELDKESGAIIVDRFMHTAMHYPCNYGFVPHTLALDGDPIDALVVAPSKIVPGAVVSVRPVGVLVMSDEKGQDEKLLCVPTSDLHPFYAEIVSYRDLPQIMIDQISHFFEHYKDLEKNKWVKVEYWGEPAEAQKLIEECIKRYEDEGGD
jgi:inorganic pyrophosphatase